MKKLILFMFTLFTLSLSAQTVTDKFAGWANVITVNGNNVTIGQFLGNPSKFDNTFVLTDMQVGDILWTSSCSRFIVTAISGNVLTISDPDAGLSVFPFNGERIGFSREIMVNGFLAGSVPQNGDGNAGAISGVSISSNACILNHYLNNVNNAIITSWSKKGNIVTATDFLGTTNNQALNLKVNNEKAGQIDPVLNNTSLGYQVDKNANPLNTNNVHIGAFAGNYNPDGVNNTVVGTNAMNVLVGKQTTLTVGGSSVNPIQDRFYVPNHNVIVGNKLWFRFEGANAAFPAPINTPQWALFKAIKVDTLELQGVNITATNTGSFMLRPQETYNNVDVFGNYAYPKANNQIVLGMSAKTTLKVADRHIFDVSALPNVDDIWVNDGQYWKPVSKATFLSGVSASGSSKSYQNTESTTPIVAADTDYNYITLTPDTGFDTFTAGDISSTTFKNYDVYINGVKAHYVSSTYPTNEGTYWKLGGTNAIQSNVNINQISIIKR